MKILKTTFPRKDLQNIENRNQCLESGAQLFHQHPTWTEYCEKLAPKVKNQSKMTFVDLNNSFLPKQQGGRCKVQTALYNPIRLKIISQTINDDCIFAKTLISHNLVGEMEKNLQKSKN